MVKWIVGGALVALWLYVIANDSDIDDVRRQLCKHKAVTSSGLISAQLGSQRYTNMSIDDHVRRFHPTPDHR